MDILGVDALIYGVLDLLGDLLHLIERYRLLAFAALIPATLFRILYAKWFPFWKSTLGRALMTKAFGMMLLVDTAVVFYLFPDIPPMVKQVAGFIMGILVVAGMWWQLAAIVKIRRADQAVFEQHKADAMYRTDDAAHQQAENTEFGEQNPHRR
jgi:hypothetical protein